MTRPAFEEQGPRLILRSGTLPPAAALLTLALALPVEAWLLSTIAALLRSGAGLSPIGLLGVGALIVLIFILFALFAPLSSELCLDPARQRADLRERRLIGGRHRSWPLAALPMPQIRYDKGHTDSLPAWELHLPLPGMRPGRGYCVTFHFRGTASVDDHLARERRTAETLQARVSGLIAEARSTGRAI